MSNVFIGHVMPEKPCYAYDEGVETGFVVPKVPSVARVFAGAGHFLDLRCGC